MKFIDEALITVRAGHGGDGAVSFRREAYVPRGGPDGGNGGRGGDVVLVAAPAMGTLLHFKYRPEFKAEDGGRGGGKDCTGKDGESLRVLVPCGTEVYDADSGEMIKGLVRPGEEWVAARGGRGGRGNASFKSPVHRAPRQAQPGRPGEERRLRLVLKLIADVGLVGKPNAGKSTLISRVSAARPKIADYPFTTLAPQLGVVRAGQTGDFVIADMPGLIEGASLGHGLGLAFLKHLERTRLLLHLVDCQAPDPLAEVQAINRELAAFSPGLGAKPQIVVLTKADLLGPQRLRPTKRKMEKLGYETRIVSAVSGYGIPQLIKRAAARLAELAEENRGKMEDEES